MKHLITLIALVLNLALSAQTSDLKISTPYSILKNSMHNYYFPKDDQVLSVKYGFGKLLFQKLKPSEETQAAPIIPENLPNGIDFEEVITFNNKYYFFYSVLDRKLLKQQLYVWEIDFETSNFIGQSKLLISADFDIIPNEDKQRFFFETSPNKNYLAVKYQLKAEKKTNSSNQDRFVLSAYNGDFDELWNSQMTMPHFESQTSHKGFSIDNEQNIYLLTEILNDGEKKNTINKAPNYTTEIISITDQGKKNASSKFETSGKLTYGARLLQANGKLFILGSTCKFSTKSTGALIASFDEDGTFSEPINIDLSTEEMSGLLIARNIVTGKDGSLFLLLENEDTDHWSDGQKTYNYYIYGTATICKVDANLNLIYSKNILKYYKTTHNLIQGFRYLLTDENLSLIYNYYDEYEGVFIKKIGVKSGELSGEKLINTADNKSYRYTDVDITNLAVLEKIKTVALEMIKDNKSGILFSKEVE
ncbi:hypothetical protein [Fluviicola sp.]|uniref:hypothetical protein n=1 Tax=Fluviicola sp. TaxID=1917219 RepID=UPI003D2C7B35